MYFHLIGIKEKNGNKYDLDILLQGGDEDFIRKFLGHRGVVIVSITEFTENPKTFGNITLSVIFNDVNIQIFTKGEDLGERLYFIIFLGLIPTNANYIENPIAQDQVKELIESNLLKIKEEDEKIKKQQEFQELKEQKKYEETGITEGLKAINNRIDHMEQLLKAGSGIISGSDVKSLYNYSNEMKKIRLGTNFNKMAMLILDTNALVKRIEREIFEANKDKSFLINKNTSITNIDLLSEYFYMNRISDESKLGLTGLSPAETMFNVLGMNSIVFILLAQDTSYIFKNTTINEIFSIVLNLIEYIVLSSIIVMCLIRLFTPLFGINKTSLYFLPAMGWLGFLLYLFNNLKLKGITTNLIGFILLALVYWQGLELLLNTFALK